jgi:carboxyl-terminal processing protease
LRQVRAEFLILLAGIFSYAAVSGIAVARAEPRVALVIGNSNYGGDLGVLPNPANDAMLMAKTLRQVGFDVIEVEDADQRKMKRAIVDFGDKLSAAGSGSTGLFFYAGHGLQVGGDNYLIPVHADIKKESDVDVEAVPVDLVMKQMDFAASAVNIVILDACRNNPLSRGFRSVTRGLAEIKTKPLGSFISYSTAPGEVAADGNGPNSPYTAALAEAILRPGLDLEEVFRTVRKSVLQATNQKQIPWDSWSLTDPYYFVPPSAAPQPLALPGEASAAPATPQAAAVDPKQIELSFWESIKNSRDPADFQAYLDQYPGGDFAKLAANRLKALGAVQTAESDRAVTQPQGATGGAPGGATAGSSAPLVFGAIDRFVYTKDQSPLYATPDATTEPLTRAVGGLAVRATGQSPDGAWWQLHLPNGGTAFAKRGDIDEQPPAPAPDATAADAGSAAAGQDVPPPDPVAQQYFSLGQALFEQGELKGARDAFDKAAERNPKDPQALLRSGQASLELGDLDAARASLDRAIAVDPATIAAHGLRILVRLDSGDAAAAAQDADATQAIEPTFWSVNAVAAYYLSGRLKDAETMADRVVTDDPGDAHNWIWQALVLRAEGRDGEAADQLQSSFDAIGNRDWPVPIIEWMLGKREADRVVVAAKSDDARRMLRQTCEADFFLGEAAHSAGDRDNAARLLGQAAEAKVPDLLAFAAAKALLAGMARE